MPDLNAPSSLVNDIAVKPVDLINSAQAGRYQAQEREKPVVAEMSMGDRVMNGISELGAKLKEFAEKLGIVKSAVDNLSVDQVLDDPNKRKFLRDQAKKDLSLENIDFLMDVKKFEKEPSPELAKEISDKYLVAGANKQVNVSKKMLDAVAVNISNSNGEVDKDLFSDVKIEVSKLVRQNSLSLLKKDPDFVNYIGMENSLDVQGLKAGQSLVNTAMEQATPLKSNIDMYDASLPGRLATIDKNLEQLNDIKPPIKFLLEDREGREILREVLAKEFSPENLDFLEAVTDFENNPSSAKAIAIRDTYIKEGSDFQVNISSAERNATVAALDNLTPDSVLPEGFNFNRNKEVITNLVSSDSYSRFINADRSSTKDKFNEYIGNKISNLQEVKVELNAVSDRLKNDLLEITGSALKQLPNEAVPQHRYASRS